LKKLLIALSIFFLAFDAFGAQKISIRKFGGLNTRTNPYEITDSESVDNSNFVLDEAGTLTKRGLFERYNSTTAGATAFTNLYKFYTSSDAGYLIIAGGTKLYKATSGSLTDIGITGNTVTENSQWSFESFTDGTNELVFGANQGQGICTWNGTNANFRSEGTGSTPSTNCSLLKKHKARLFAAGSKTYPYRLYYSSLNQGRDWTTSGGSMDLPSYEKIMALEVLSDVIFIFTRTSIYALLGDTPQEFTIQKTRSTIGTHAYKSVIVGNKLIYFLNKSGVFAFDGDEAINISETIQPTIDAISNTYIGGSASLFDKRGRLWLSYTSTNGTFNDTIIVYDTVLKQWYMLNGANFSAFFKADGGTDKGEIFASCSDNVGYLWKLQESSALEQIVFSSNDQLNNCVTFNTATTYLPGLSLQSGYDSNAVFLANFNGTDGSTSYTPETGQTLTWFDVAKLSTDQKAFGGSSLWLSGNSYLTTPHSENYWFTTNPFTIDGWFRFTSLPNPGSSTILVSGYYPIGLPGNELWQLSLNNTAGVYDLYFEMRAGGVGVISFGRNWTPSTNTWYHVALIRGWGGNVNDFALTVNGEILGAVNTDADPMSSLAFTIFIGEYGGGGAYYLQCYIDSLRFTKGLARWTSNFNANFSEYARPTFDGTLTSQPIQINASGQSSLGAISWQKLLQTNTDIQFTVRTGATSDTVYYNGWSTWASSNVVTMNSVTNSVVWYNQDKSVFKAETPTTPQSRNILFYETDDTASASCVQFDVSRGVVSFNRYSSCMVPNVNITNDKFIGYWLKSPCTGNSVKLDIGEVSNTTVAYTTANTVTANEWEFHHWPLSGITSTDIDAIKYMKITYLGDVQGSLYLGDVSAYNFLENDATITSTPNDYIQFRSILGSNDYYLTPKLVLGAGYVIKLSYSTSGGSSESSLTSYWKSKVFDGGLPVNKLWQWLDFSLESQNPTTGHTVTLNYWTDDGRQSGTVSKAVDVTGRTVNVKFYLPQGTFGRNFQFEVQDANLESQLKIKNVDIFVSPEGNS
jgi:hypothetical protein